MITKITAQKLFFNQLHHFYFSNFTQPGSSVVFDVPNVQLPVRAKFDQQDRFSKREFYKLNNYLHKDRPPRCRYYALQYKNRIYHVYNAYYYPMGRMISQISTTIRGKNSPLYRNSQADIKNGDICIIVNAQDPLFTGKKLLFKNLKYHTGFVGHLKSYSYKHVLNNKPQLLYYYLIRKCMPKNKVSGKYLENLKIFRGPTHNIPQLPQFAPDKNIYEYLPQANLDQMIKLHPDIKLVQQSTQGLAKSIHGRDFQYVRSKEDIETQYKLNAQQHEDTSKLHKRPVQTRDKLNYSPNELKKLRNKQLKIQDRYKEVRAPYKKKQVIDTGFAYIKDERKARKMPDYKILADEDLPEDDEEIVDDPYGRKAKIAAEKKAKQNKK